jgi:mRNA-degrading endonuclease RelE of RelBE toxin-antitoxin system
VSAENIVSLIPEPLTGQFEGVFKLRVGDYRVLYTLDKTEASTQFTLFVIEVKSIKLSSQLNSQYSIFAN